jgi:flagellar motor switch protein FliN/FliY
MAALSAEGDMAPLVFASSAPSADEVRRALVCGLDVVECAFYVRMAGGGQGWVRLWLSAHLIKNLELFFMRARLTSGELGRLERTPCGQAPAQLQVIAGVVELEADVIASLGRGDVVFFDEHGVSSGPDEAPRRARLYTRGPGSPWVYARCRINEARRWEVVPCSALEHPRTTTAGSVQMAQEQAEGGIGVAMAQEVPVLVEVRLGAVTMPIAALTRLAQGQVLTLAQPVGSPVEVLAGGRVLALGELVSVEGRVGVRLTQVRNQ